MSKNTTFVVERDKKNRILMQALLSELPAIVSEFVYSKTNIITTNTALVYTYNIREFFLWLRDTEPFDDTKDISVLFLSNLKTYTFEQYSSYLSSKENPNSNGTAKTKLCSVSSFFQYLYIRDLISENPMAKLVRPKEKKDRTIIKLSSDEVSALLHAVQNGSALFQERQWKYLEHTRDRDYAILVLLLNTGIRVSECIGINLEDINFSESAVMVSRKGGKKQTIPMNGLVAESIQRYLEIRQEIPSESHALFLSLQNKRMTTAAVERLVGKYSEAAGIRKAVSPHKLRKTYGTALYKQTKDIYLVAGALGHESVVTTTKHYVENDLDALKDAMETFKLK